MTTDPRALIAEGKRHLATLETSKLAKERAVAWGWLCDRNREILQGYASALDEIVGLTAQRDAWKQDAADNMEAGCRIAAERESALGELVALRTSLAEQALVIEQQDRDMERMRAVVDRLTAERDLGDRMLSETAPYQAGLRADLAAARDMNRHYEQERDAWPAAYKQRAAQTDERIAELEAGLREALNLADVPERNQDDEWYAHREALNDTLNPTGDP